MSDDSPSDDGGLSLHAAFDIAVGLGRSVDTMGTKLDALLKYLRKAEPRFVTFPQNVTTDDSGDDIVIDFGTPNQGCFWEVRHVSVGGSDAGVTVGGSAFLYVSAQVVGPVVGGMNNCVDIAGGLPNIAYYPSGSLVVKAREHLFLVIHGGDDNTLYAANAFVRQYAEATPEMFSS